MTKDHAVYDDITIRQMLAIVRTQSLESFLVIALGMARNKMQNLKDEIQAYRNYKSRQIDIQRTSKFFCHLVKGLVAPITKPIQYAAIE